MLSIQYLCTLLSQLAHNVARSLLMVTSGCKICFAILAKLEASKSNPITNGWHQGHSIHILYTVSDQLHFHLSQLRESCPAIYCRVATYYSQGKKVDLLFVALFPLSLADFTCLSVVTLPNTSTWHSWQFASLRSKNHQNCRHFAPLEKHRVVSKHSCTSTGGYKMSGRKTLFTAPFTTWQMDWSWFWCHGSEQNGTHHFPRLACCCFCLCTFFFFFKVLDLA